jgi:O-acetyl-ADP-ribose deacetylase (regulator of RNase III)
MTGREPYRIAVGSAVITLVSGDITLQDTDAIVNAANPGLLGGGGVDGAVHRAGGPVILEECRAIRAQTGECPAGSAVMTGGGRLKARHVIHAVGPVWHGGDAGEDALLRSAYDASLQLALKHRLHSMAFPCISTGAYGFPADRAARIAVSTVRAFLQTHAAPHEVRFAVFSEKDYELYHTLLRDLQRIQG